MCGMFSLYTTLFYLTAAVDRGDAVSVGLVLCFYLPQVRLVASLLE